MLYYVISSTFTQEGRQASTTWFYLLFVAGNRHEQVTWSLRSSDETVTVGGTNRQSSRWTLIRPHGGCGEEMDALLQNRTTQAWLHHPFKTNQRWRIVTAKSCKKNPTPSFHHISSPIRWPYSSPSLLWQFCQNPHGNFPFFMYALHQLVLRLVAINSLDC